jgi:SMODS-associated NUDIX domain
MVTDFVSNLLAAAVATAVAVVWRSRGWLRGGLEVGRAVMGRGRRIRVSYCAVLRVREAGRCVLFRSPSRPESFGPPGGVIKYRDNARATLDRLGFVDELWPGREAEMRRDLRGFVPSGSVLSFQSWFRAGVDRESAEQCLRRELCEELVEVGLPDLVPAVSALTFNPARAVAEGPRKVPGHDYLQLRRFEVYEIALDDSAAVDFVRRLIEAADDPHRRSVCCAGVEEMREGRCQAGLVAPHTVYLIGTRKLASDVPPIRHGATCDP